MFDDRDFDIGLFAGESDEEIYELTFAEHAADRPVEPHVLPGALEEIEPGLFLAGILASVDVERLSGFDLVRYVQARERLVSHDSAALYAGIAELAHSYDPDTPARVDHCVEFASEEIQTALCKTRRSADYELGLALDLRHRVPAVWKALDEGRIDLARARVFARELEVLEPGLVSDVVDQIVDEASGLTTGQLRARLKKLCLLADPRSAIDSFQAGLEDRKLVTIPNPDHTAGIHLDNIDPVHAVTAARNVNHIAMSLKRQAGETRTIDQLRADIAVDLLRGATIEGTAPVTPVIEVHIRDDAAAHIPGYGPVLDTTLSRDQEDIRVESGSPEDDCSHETDSRRPTAAQARHVRSRYPTCIFPGCRMPAGACDIDHRLPYSKVRRTNCQNLAPLCRHHHVCKDRSNWTLERNPDGSHTWTSPLGHTHTTGRPP